MADPASPTESAPRMIHSNRLAVEIAAPGTIYQRTRFDWTGFITQVTLDGSHTFCVPEDYNPKEGTGGIGLCNEFGIEKSVGYVDAKPGDTFPKLGIGLLHRPDDAPYNFFRPYEITQSFPIQIETSSNQVRFTVQPIDCRGYAVCEEKTIRLEDNCLVIAYHLENVGQQPVITHEYCHNFVGIDQQPIGPGYCMRFPYRVEFEKMLAAHAPEILRVNDREIHWQSTPQNPFYSRPTGFHLTDQPQWELIYEPGGVGMREYNDFAPSCVAVWGTTHVVSAEIFIDIHLEPGQTQSWSRRYEFFTTARS